MSQVSTAHPCSGGTAVSYAFPRFKSQSKSWTHAPFFLLFGEGRPLELCFDCIFSRLENEGKWYSQSWLLRGLWEPWSWTQAGSCSLSSHLLRHQPPSEPFCLPSQEWPWSLWFLSGSRLKMSVENSSLTTSTLLWPSQQGWHPTDAPFISVRRPVSSHMSVSASTYNVCTEFSFQGGMGSFPRRCQERGMLKRRKRCHHFYDGLLCKLKDFSYNTLYLHIFSYFHGTQQGKDQEGKA